MSRFGIRRRLKAKLGRTNQVEEQEVERFTVLFHLPDGTQAEVETEAHYTLHMVSQMLETPIEVGCPDGHCGGCLVDLIEDSGMQVMGERELTVIRDEHKRDPAEDERLACHARVLGPGVEVRVHKVWSLEDIRGE